VLSKSLAAARVRLRRNPRWAWRLIDNEEWAVKAPTKSPIGELTTRRQPSDMAVTTRPESEVA
jgi:hypothetical protein